MSAQLLEQGTLKDLAEKRDEYALYCARKTQDSLDQMRLNQGIVQGLELAMEILNHRANNLHG